MEPRALKNLVQIPKAKRNSVIADGLELLVDHVKDLRLAGEHLIGGGYPQAARKLDAIRGEEAAKALILLDLVRHDWQDPSIDSRLIKAFADHLSRGLYVHLTAGSPADLAELRERTDGLRQSHYPDGPTDVDWIFRNQIESEREEAIYVDYVHEEEGDRWISPLQRSYVTSWPADISTKLIESMSRLGLLSAEGLELISLAWRDAVIDDRLAWPEHARRTITALQGAIRAGLPAPSATDADVVYVRDRWIFPIGTLEFSPIKVKTAELAERRANTSPY